MSLINARFVYGSLNIRSKLARYLQLAENLDGFRIKLRERAKMLDVCERQPILRLLVKEVLVAADSLTMRHAIPIPQTGPVSNGLQPTGSHPSGATQNPGYLLRSRSSFAAFGERLSSLRIRPVGPSVASKAGARRCYRRALRG